MKTKKNKVGRPKLKKEVKVKSKPKKKNKDYKEAALYYLSNTFFSSERLLDIFTDAVYELQDINSKLDKLITPVSPPVEEPKSEETPK